LGVGFFLGVFVGLFLRGGVFVSVVGVSLNRKTSFHGSCAKKWRHHLSPVAMPDAVGGRVVSAKDSPKGKKGEKFLWAPPNVGERNRPALHWRKVEIAWKKKRNFN